MSLLWPLVFLMIGKLFIMSSRADRILVLSPMGTKSHAYGFLPAIEGLAERGHQVTLITAHVHKIRSPNIRNIVIEGAAAHVDGDLQTFEGENLLNAIKGMLSEFRSGVSVGYGLFMANEEVKEIIRTRPVDLIILDGIVNEATLPLVDFLKVPYILYSPASSPPWILNAMGAYKEYSVIPSIGLSFKARMTFFQRFMNAFLTEVFLLARKLFVLDLVDELAKKDFPNSRSAAEVERGAELCLVNIDRVTGRARSLPPTMIPVGAMQCGPPKPLPEVNIQDANHLVSYSLLLCHKKCMRVREAVNKDLLNRV